MNYLIKYFLERPLLSNVIFFGVIALGLFSWFSIGKEEMPEFESNWVRISTNYPGSSSGEVERYITKPIEEELKSIAGLDSVRSNSSLGMSSVSVVIDDGFSNKSEVVQEIQDAVNRVMLPAEVIDKPIIRHFKSSEKAILDIGIYLKGYTELSDEKRRELQNFVLSFESQLTGLKEISSIDKSNYLKPELRIEVDPKKIEDFQISLSEIRNQIRSNNILYPVGSLSNKSESRAILINELEDEQSLKSLVLRGNYSGDGITLKEMAKVKNSFAKNNSIIKINGHEAVFLNVRKNSSVDILTAKDAVLEFIEKFKQDQKFGIVLMDDESYAITNGLSIIRDNGLFGFLLILILLFVFLNFKTGFWVAMGIPFCMGFTVVIASLLGNTINSMTLSGLIIVLGIVVDDAIIVSENIIRKIESGMSKIEAGFVGVQEVWRPILASVVTTCVAFIPLFYFDGFFGKLVMYIPLIVILMLFGSLLESLFILPSHISFDRKEKLTQMKKKGWLKKIENSYGNSLKKTLKYRHLVLFLFVSLAVGAGFLFKHKINYVMFPRSESKEVYVKIIAKDEFNRSQTAKALAPIEKVFYSDTKNVVGVRSTIGVSRYGGGVKENQASIIVELFPATKRNESLDQLLDRWKKETQNIQNIKEVKFLRGRWGHSSGSAIELQVLENDDQIRGQVLTKLEESMKNDPELKGVEVDRPLEKEHFLFKLNQRKLTQYNISPASVTVALRSFLEGSILYSINKGNEEVDVRLTVPEENKDEISNLLEIYVQNNSGQMTKLRKIVEVIRVNRPISIKRDSFKRSTMLYANLSKKDGVPLKVAERYENGLFREILKEFPTTVLKFKGEIEDTRDSSSEFIQSIILVILLIYFILIVLFNSVITPVFILSIVPFGVSGVVFAFYAHGMELFGFMSAIGTLGMIGVVINDSIVMVDKIEKTIKGGEVGVDSFISAIVTRFRPVILTTLTTVVGVLPTAYGFAGYDQSLSDMMFAMGWGLALGTFVTLFFVPVIFSYRYRIK